MQQRPAELSVFQSKTTRRPLQKPKSLTNLSLPSDGDRRPSVRNSNWFGNAAKASQREPSRLSRFLSRSVQSLHHHAGASNAWSLLPSGQAPGEGVQGWDQAREGLQGDSDEDSRSEEEETESSRPSSRSWAEEEGESCVREGAALLDDEVILSMLGDLQRALAADLLGEWQP